jgi:hypothetical protein
MGRLTVDNELCQMQPELMIMILRWLEREEGAVLIGSRVRKSAGVTDFDIEGTDIPEGDGQFGVLLQKIVDGVVAVTIVIF